MTVATSASFSPCMKYRYTLTRIWDSTLPVAAFIGLNPSTADDKIDDPTIRRCTAFAKREGCGGLMMLNLFAYRATKPEDMKAAESCIGKDNRIADFLDLCDGPHIACWGTHGAHLGRGPWLANLLDGLQCFGTNADGSPKHPLYLKADTPLKPFGRAKR